VSDAKIGDICSREMAFGVTSFNFTGCLNVLRSHTASPAKEAAAKPEPPDRRACREIGLQEGLPEYETCVQQLYQLVIDRSAS
jgi:hypothetical protein